MISLKIGELKPRYAFADISVMCKVDSGEYVNFTDFAFATFSDTVLINIESDAKFLLVLCTYARHDIYYSEVSIDELYALAGISGGTKFVKQISNGIEDKVAAEIVARMAANKILNYAYGFCTQAKDDEFVYEFHRQKFDVSPKGSKQRVFPVVLTKKFIKSDKEMRTPSRNRY